VCIRQMKMHAYVCESCFLPIPIEYIMSNVTQRVVRHILATVSEAKLEA
jgi:hypothetical protein